jgi:hypothetical protein
LADAFLFESFSLKQWQVIIQRLFEILDLFQTHHHDISASAYQEIYLQKTLARLEELCTLPFWSKLLEHHQVKINDHKFHNLRYFLPKIKRIIPQLMNTEQMCVIHGDLCLSNILFDPTSRIFKFIDPRGSFGQTGIFGDLKYDIAKLRHSFCGYYDFIVSDLFEIENSQNEFRYECYTEASHHEIGAYFDMVLDKLSINAQHIKLIEALLFLSMIPLHSDNFARQKIMYVRGIELLNGAL